MVVKGGVEREAYDWRRAESVDGAPLILPRLLAMRAAASESLGVRLPVAEGVRLPPPPTTPLPLRACVLPPTDPGRDDADAPPGTPTHPPGTAPLLPCCPGVRLRSRTPASFASECSLTSRGGSVGTWKGLFAAGRGCGCEKVGQGRKVWGNVWRCGGGRCGEICGEMAHLEGVSRGGHPVAGAGLIEPYGRAKYRPPRDQRRRRHSRRAHWLAAAGYAWLAIGAADAREV